MELVTTIKKFIPHAVLTVVLTAISLTAIYGLPFSGSSNVQAGPSREECLFIVADVVTPENSRAAFSVAREMKKSEDEFATAEDYGMPPEVFAKFTEYTAAGCAPRHLRSGAI